MGFKDVIQAGDEAFAWPETEVLLPLLALHKTRASGSPDYRPGFRGSELGYLCLRESVLKVLFPRGKEPIPPGLQDIFDVGHAVHERWQNFVLGPAGVLEGWWHCRTCDWKVEGVMPTDICPSCKSLRRCGSCKAKLKDGIYKEGHACHKCQSSSWEYEEYTLQNKEYGIVGHCDGVLNINNIRYIWEFKTINSGGYEGRLPYGPMKQHVVQVQVYMWLRGLKYAIIHYLNKNTSEQKEFLVEYEDSFRKEIIRKIELVREHRKNKTLPDTGVCSSRQSRQAKSCPWVRECFNYKEFKKTLTETQTPAHEEE